MTKRELVFTWENNCKINGGEAKELQCFELRRPTRWQKFKKWCKRTFSIWC